tara:strand:+ start:33 stop:218 length:186 start_codon:yes stop_codon:yes gene_type:complete
MPWPSNIPHDLARDLARLDEYRSAPKDADRWGVIKEWLERHGVEAPAVIPEAPQIPSAGGH